MTIQTSVDLDKILKETDLDFISEDFIQEAKVTTDDGEDYYITIDECHDIMSSDESLRDQGIENIIFIIDSEYVKKIITENVEYILKKVTV